MDRLVPETTEEERKCAPEILKVRQRHVRASERVARVPATAFKYINTVLYAVSSKSRLPLPTRSRGSERVARVPATAFKKLLTLLLAPVTPFVTPKVVEL